MILDNLSRAFKTQNGLTVRIVALEAGGDL
jgi:hypothetical protein